MLSLLLSVLLAKKQPKTNLSLGYIKSRKNYVKQTKDKQTKDKQTKADYL